MNRERIKIRRGLVGSSDRKTVSAIKAVRQSNHNEFIKSELYVRCNKSEGKYIPKDNELVKVRCLGRYVTMPYGVVKSAGYSNYILI